MSEIVRDSVSIDLTIDSIPFNVIEATVERTQSTKSNYVEMEIRPEPSAVDQLPDDITDLISKEVELRADTTLVAKRSDGSDSNSTEDTLLFTGNIQTISPTGVNTYSALAFDPVQSVFVSAPNSGSFLNQEILISGSTILIGDEFDLANEEQPSSIKASTLINQILDKAGIPEERRKINLSDSGSTLDPLVAGGGRISAISDGPDRPVATDEVLRFNSTVLTVGEALQRAARITRSEWSIGKRGNFYFGKPEVKKFDLQLIKDTTAGITTPPYQSVEVIAPGIASSNIVNETAASFIQEPTDVITKRAVLTDPLNSNQRGIILGPNDRQFENAKPTFTYRDAAINTDQQAENTTLRIADELIKQQAEGTITLVGFPEIDINDAVVLPQQTDESPTNPPMGGGVYAVYTVRHILSGSDGFVTEIDVSAPTAATREVAVVQPQTSTTTVDRPTYKDNNDLRELLPGAGTGSVNPRTIDEIAEDINDET